MLCNNAVNVNRNCKTRITATVIEQYRLVISVDAPKEFMEQQQLTNQATKQKQNQNLHTQAWKTRQDGESN